MENGDVGVGVEYSRRLVHRWLLGHDRECTLTDAGVVKAGCMVAVPTLTTGVTILPIIVVNIFLYEKV